MLLFSWMSAGRSRARRVPARAQFRLCARGAALGVSDPVIMLRHVLPNAMVATLTFLPFILNGSITTLTSLDFLGFGLPPGSPSLGELLAAGQEQSAGAMARPHRVLRPRRDAEPADLHRRGRARRLRSAQDRGMRCMPLLAIEPPLRHLRARRRATVAAVRDRFVRARQGRDAGAGRRNRARASR